MSGEFRYLGVGEENEFGIPVAATVFLDYLSTGLDSPTDSFLTYAGAAGKGPRTFVPGPYIPSGDLQIGMDIVEAVHLLKWVMGRYGTNGTEGVSPETTTLAAAASARDTTIVINDEAGFSTNDYVQLDAGIGGDVVQITGLDGGAGPTYNWTITPLINPHGADADVKEVVAPFVHIFRPPRGDALPSFTARLGKTVFEHVFTGATIDRLSLGVERGFLTCTANVQCQKDSQLPLNNAPKSLVSDILTFRQGVTLLADVDHTANVEEFSIEIANNLDGTGGIRHGSRFPAELPVQGVDVSGSLTLAFKNLNEYTRFWGQSTGADEDASSAFKLEQQFRIGEDWLKFVLGSVHWTQIATPVSGRNRILQSVQFVSLEDAVWDLIHIEAINNKVRY